MCTKVYMRSMNLQSTNLLDLLEKNLSNLTREEKNFTFFSTDMKINLSIIFFLFGYEMQL